MEETKVQYLYKREEVMNAALAAINENSDNRLISYNQLAGFIHYNIGSGSIQLGSNDVFIIGIEDTLGNTEITIQVIGNQGIIKNPKYIIFVAYIIEGISRNLAKFNNRK